MIKLPKVVKLTGVSFGNAQENIKTFGCPDIRWFALFREPGNQHDPNAIRVALFGEFFMGYVPKEIAHELAPMMDSGIEFDAEFVCVNKHPQHDIVGITVKIIEAAPSR
jgi:hypothetical protein